MASALDILSSGKKTEKEFLDKTNDSLFIQTDDLFDSQDKFSFGTEDSVQESKPIKTKSNALDVLSSEENRYLDEEQREDNVTFFEGAIDVVQDIAMQPFGGLVDAAESIVNLDANPPRGLKSISTRSRWGS